MSIQSAPSHAHGEGNSLLRDLRKDGGAGKGDPLVSACLEDDMRAAVCMVQWQDVFFVNSTSTVWAIVTLFFIYTVQDTCRENEQ